jgi:hypothetical protein
VLDTGNKITVIGTDTNVVSYQYKKDWSGGGIAVEIIKSCINFIKSTKNTPVPFCRCCEDYAEYKKRKESH